MFGLSGHEGNHGEDAKELWWYRDAMPDASWLAWRYVYPQAPFPYESLLAENAQRDRTQPEHGVAVLRRPSDESAGGTGGAGQAEAAVRAGVHADQPR